MLCPALRQPGFILRLGWLVQWFRGGFAPNECDSKTFLREIHFYQGHAQLLSQNVQLALSCLLPAPLSCLNLHVLAEDKNEAPGAHLAFIKLKDEFEAGGVQSNACISIPDVEMARYPKGIVRSGEIQCFVHVPPAGCLAKCSLAAPWRPIWKVYCKEICLPICSCF